MISRRQNSRRFPGFCIWRAPDQDGVILHNARWGPLLFSYGDLDVHHATSNYAGEGHVLIDDDYVYRNYGNSDDIQVITDFDEITYISITEADVLAVGSCWSAATGLSASVYE